MISKGLLHSSLWFLFHFGSQIFSFGNNVYFISKSQWENNFNLYATALYQPYQNIRINIFVLGLYFWLNKGQMKKHGKACFLRKVRIYRWFTFPKEMYMQDCQTSLELCRSDLPVFSARKSHLNSHGIKRNWRNGLLCPTINSFLSF